MRTARGNSYGEAVPGVAAHAGMALLGPRLTAQERWPCGVVEVWSGPYRFAGYDGGISRLEVPGTIERHYRLAACIEIEGLGMQRTRTHREAHCED